MIQSEAYDQFIPLINSTGKIYFKSSLVFARLARTNEYIETWTADGLETTNYAKLGDFVLQNLQTHYQEVYIVSKDMFRERYEFFYMTTIDNEEGCVCIPKGKVKAAVYQGGELEFLANWGRYMILKPGDLIVSPYPNYNEVYRIAAQEFFETYSLAEDQD